MINWTGPTWTDEAYPKAQSKPWDARLNNAALYIKHGSVVLVAAALVGTGVWSLGAWIHELVCRCAVVAGR